MLFDFYLSMCNLEIYCKFVFSFKEKRLMKFIILIILLFPLSINMNGQIPTNHLVLWLDADSGIAYNGSKIQQWSDLSGNGFHLTQSTPANQPLITPNVFVGNSAVTFNGNEFLEVNFGQVFPQPFTVFIFYNSTSSSTQFIFDFSTPRTALYLASDRIRMFAGTDLDIVKTYPFGFYIATLEYNSPNSKNRENSTNVSTGNCGNNGMGGIRIGSAYNSSMFFYGSITEMIVYDTIFSDSERLIIEEYLANKHAPPVNLGSNVVIDHSFCSYRLSPGSGYTSYLWSTGSTADSILVSQTGDYWVQVTDIFGRVSSDTIHVEFPYASLPDSAFCLTDTITMNTGLNHAYTFFWNDGSTDSLLHIWNPGTYWVEITDSTLAACSVRDTFVVVADSFPILATLGPDTSLCAGVNITLQSGNASATSYLWSTSDTTQYITINSPDNYSVTVTDTLGCVAKDTIQITIHGQAPVPNFTWENICFGDSTQLVDSSYTIDNSHIISWQWQLPDTSLTTQNVTFTFSDTGSFSVILVINTDSNCSNTIQKQVTIHTLPQADFSTTQLCNNVPINFSENITSIDSITTYLWDFGDTSTDTTANPTHEYTNSGNFSVSLTVTSLFGCEDSITKTLEIKPSPVIDFSHSVLCSGKQAQFNDLSITSPIFPIISWQWDFGDNTTSTTSNPIHIYSDTGTYIVSLAAQSLNGCTQNKTDTITVFPSQQTNFYADSLCANTTNQLTDSTIITGDSISTWSWYINNKLESNEQSPEFYFQDDGTYLITLLTQTTHQCEDSISKYLQVNPTPNSTFAFYPEIGTPIYYLSFSTDSNLNYLWDFGDSFTSTEQNPQHLYINSGSYQVTLITSNNYGCHDTTQKTVLVVLPVYDVAILDYTPQQTGNYLSFSCRFLNMGSLPLDSVNLTLQIQDAPYIMEKWTGHIMPGTVVTYEFALHYQISGKIPSATCVEAMVSGQTEDPTPENNLKCSNSTNDFIFYSLFPNPGENTIFIEFNNPQKQTINFQIIDKLGKIVFTDKLEQLSKGFQRIKININYLESGTYTFKIFSNIDSAEKQFMVH